VRRFAWIVVLAILIAAWQAWVDLRSVPDYLLPSPGEIARTLWDERSTLAHEAGVTVREMLFGFALAVVFGLGAAIVLARVAWLRNAFYPLLIGSQSVPVIAVAPLFLYYLGFGLAPIAAMVALICFFPITASALDGFDRAPADLVRTMRTLNASPRAIFWRVQLPWAAPRVFTGARIAASYAAVAAVFSELAGSSGGLGDSMRDQLDTPLVGAAVVVLAVLALLLFGAVTLLERLIAPWGRD
jgi:putative hydroxymethylpyrimidine transport system permease protein